MKSDVSIVNVALNNSPTAASCIHEQLKKIPLFLNKYLPECLEILYGYSD
ncbi:TPA: hypothetical protein ACN32H_001929 [Vibrio parahaemolyticus]